MSNQLSGHGQSSPGVVQGSAPLPPGFELEMFEHGFDHLKSLVPKATNQVTVTRLLRSLAYELRRHPENLRGHVQRINLLCRERVDKSRLFDATLTLFAVLEDKGQALREMILRQTLPLLDANQVDLLRSASGKPCAQAPVESPAATAIVTPVDHHATAETNPIEYADELLFAGDYAEAMAVLEMALAKTPDSTTIAESLQAIYRSARDAKGYRRTRDSVIALAPGTASIWPPTEIFFAGL